jgi:hypothetical protein
MMKFSHIGLTTDTPREGETWVEKTRVWVTPTTSATPSPWKG